MDYLQGQREEELGHLWGALRGMSIIPLGVCRNSTGDLGTDKLFTGQRLDGTGLYYYGGRYYDPTIGRFISADTIVPDFTNPQAFNRYSYALNNPLRYIDPTGNYSKEQLEKWGFTTDNTSRGIYRLLREANPGDELIVDYDDGSRAEYYFSEEGLVVPVEGTFEGAPVNMHSVNDENADMLYLLRSFYVQDTNLISESRSFKYCLHMTVNVDTGYTQTITSGHKPWVDEVPEEYYRSLSAVG